MADLSFFTPRVLTGVINLRPVKHDLFTSFFHEVDPKPFETFELETSLRGASILPSITNFDAGTMRKGETLNVGYVKAPRFRPKRSFRAADLLVTQKGFTPYDPRINPVERAIADDMDAHRDDIDRMLEIMCAQAAVDGRIDLYDMIEGEAVQTYAVDFKRPKNHDIKLSGDAAWSNEKSDLVGSVEDYDLLIQEDTGGLSATDLILGKDAWTAFRRHPDVLGEAACGHIADNHLERYDFHLFHSCLPVAEFLHQMGGNPFLFDHFENVVAHPVIDGTLSHNGSFLLPIESSGIVFVIHNHHFRVLCGKYFLCFSLI